MTAETLKVQISIDPENNIINGDLAWPRSKTPKLKCEWSFTRPALMFFTISATWDTICDLYNI